MHLNVFRVDAAVVAAQARGLFASEGIAVKITRMVAADLKLSPKAAAGSVAELSANGSLNVPGLESVLSLRTQFGFTPPMGPAIATYYELDYYRAAAGK